MKKLTMIVLGLSLVVWATSAEAVTVENTVSWATEPINVESYKIEKGPAQTGPWTVLPNVPAGTKQFVDGGNQPGIATCYRVTPTNTLPSTGAPGVKCNTTIGQVGDMGTITILPRFVP